MQNRVKKNADEMENYTQVHLFALKMLCHRRENEAEEDHYICGVHQIKKIILFTVVSTNWTQNFSFFIPHSSG